MKQYLVIALLALAACAPQPLRRSTLPLTVVEVAPPVEPANAAPAEEPPSDDAPPRSDSPQ